MPTEENTAAIMYYSGKQNESDMKRSRIESIYIDEKVEFKTNQPKYRCDHKEPQVVNKIAFS